MSKFNIGDKVKHKNNLEYVYTIKKQIGNILILNRPFELWEYDDCTIINISICNINNVIKIKQIL